jgi:hypothetical protein
LSQQVAILILAGNGQLDLWDFVDVFFERNGGSKFWEDIFFPATRDLMRHVVSLQKDFNERIKLDKSGKRQKMNAPKSYILDLFISHSSKDKRLAKSLIEFVRAALAIPADRVRCTSVDGYKLFGGAKTESELKKEIRDTQCFIGLITPDSLQSQFVLFELGARWGLDEHLVPILGGGITADALHPPLSNLNALNSASKSEMEQLVHDLAKALKKSVPLSASYETQLSALLKTATSGKPKRKTKEERIKVSAGKIARRNFPERFETDSDLEIEGVPLDIATAQYHPCQIRIHNRSSTKTADNVRVELVALEDAAVTGTADDYFRPVLPVILKPEIAGENTINPGASQKYNLFRVTMNIRSAILKDGVAIGWQQKFLAYFTKETTKDVTQFIGNESYRLKLAVTARDFVKAEQEFNLTFSNKGTFHCFTLTKISSKETKLKEPKRNS